MSCLRHRHATINDDGLAGDKASLIAREIGDGGGDIFGGAQTLYGDKCVDVVLYLLWEHVGHVG